MQGIIAARLDALSEEEKRLLQDAAVVGKVFWLGAVEAVDGFHALAGGGAAARARAQGVRPARRAAPRSRARASTRSATCSSATSRTARSRARRAPTSIERAAAWIESLGRPEDQAELLAHHYLQALELAEAAGLDAAALADSARHALRDAGDRAAALYAVDAAERFYDAALRLWPEDDPERAELLFRRAAPVRHLGGGDPERLAEARDALLAAGDNARAAEAEMLLARSSGCRVDATSRTARRPGRELARRRAPSRSSGWVLIRWATRASLMGIRERQSSSPRKPAPSRSSSHWEEGLSERAGPARALARVLG